MNVYEIRPAVVGDAKNLSDVRLQIDGETENLDREQGEGFLEERDFQKIIRDDEKSKKNLFLVAEGNGEIIGFSRCEGNELRRLSHQVEFGVCVLKEHWGCGIGRSLLANSLNWADSHGIRKVTLKVLETNEKAIFLYKRYGFEIEGNLKQDKLLSDGNYYNTVLMGRITGWEE